MPMQNMVSQQSYSNFQLSAPQETGFSSKFGLFLNRRIIETKSQPVSNICQIGDYSLSPSEEALKPSSKRRFGQLEDHTEAYKEKLRDRNKLKEKEEPLLPSIRKQQEKEKAKQEAEKDESDFVLISEEMSKKDYTGYVMQLHHNQDEESLKKIRVGDNYQAKIPSLLSRDDTKKPTEKKRIWNPDEHDEEKLAEYMKKLEEFIGMSGICQERAFKLYCRFSGETEKILENIRKNRNHYSAYLKPVLKNSKIS